LVIRANAATTSWYFSAARADAECYATVKRHRKSGGKVVVYMPTYRDTCLDFVDESGRVVLQPQKLA